MRIQLGLHNAPQWHVVILTCMVVATVAGCGNGLSTLSGMVTIDGKPAPKGLSFEFSPTGAGSSSYASTDQDGKYEAMFTFQKKGIQAGEHLVRITPGAVEESMPVIGPDGKPVNDSAEQPSVAMLPHQYYEQIETIMVESGHNTHDISLTTSN